jgi:DNA-binding MurR/RpiR family transcriptional regulator
MFNAEMIKLFNEREMIIYEYIVKYRDKVPYMTIRELAKETKTSTTTILRFVKKVGYDSFADFKYIYKISLQEEDKEPVYDFKEVIDCLKKFNSSFYKDKFNDAFAILSVVDTVVFLGVGNSGVIGQYGARCFSSAGKFSLAINDPYLRISTFAQKIAIIALSVSGETKEVINEIMACKSSGCKVIAITSTENCTIAKLSDVTIPYYINNKRNSTIDLTSQMPAIGIIENLATRCYI